MFSFIFKISKNNIIIDLLSIERNYVLVNSNLIGGANERRIPIRDVILNDRQGTQEFTLFDKLPVPNFYLRKIEGTSVSKGKI